MWSILLSSEDTGHSASHLMHTRQDCYGVMDRIFFPQPTFSNNISSVIIAFLGHLSHLMQLANYQMTGTSVSPLEVQLLGGFVELLGLYYAVELLYRLVRLVQLTPVLSLLALLQLSRLFVPPILDKQIVVMVLLLPVLALLLLSLLLPLPLSL